MSFASGFLHTEYLRKHFIRRLELIENEHPTAAAQGKKECCRSGVCCWSRPGTMHQDDVPKMAAFLGMSESELFTQFLVVDEIYDTLCLLPRRAHQRGGVMISTEETYSIESPCVFLDIENGNACKVHDAKPKGCRDYKCWDKDEEYVIPKFQKSELVQLGWKGDYSDDYDDSYEGDG